MSLRVSFLEAFFDSCETLSLPYSQRNEIMQDVSQLSDSELSQWVQKVDESPHPMVEWIEALAHFREWLKLNSQNRHLIAQIEYLSCCIEGFQGMGNRLPLKVMLEFYLEKHGIR